MRLLSLAFVVLTALPAVAQEIDISGAYAVAGRNADGSQYSGSLRMEQTGTTVAASWQVGNQSYSGLGQIEGRVVSINWQPGQPPVFYIVMPDGELHGTWADGYGLERLAPAK